MALSVLLFVSPVLAAGTEATDWVACRHLMFISHCPGSWRPEVRGSGLASSCEGPLPGLRMAVSSLCPLKRQREKGGCGVSFFLMRTHVPFPKAPPW